MKQVVQTRDPAPVALRKESVDRNCKCEKRMGSCEVALRKESVDRNVYGAKATQHIDASLSARRAWIEITFCVILNTAKHVALRKESVDRNIDECWKLIGTDSVALLPKPAARNSCYLSKTSRIK